MEQFKIDALLNYLGETTEMVEIETLKHDDNMTVFIDGAEYIVLTDVEADKLYHEQQMSLIEDVGMDSFSGWMKDEILNNHVSVDYEWTFDEIQRESQAAYIEDLKYMDELNQLMADCNCEDEDEFLDYLCEEDSVEWFKDNYGEDEYNRIIIENGLIDWDSVIEFCKQVDGRGHTLAHYDGNELELEGDLYAYRVN